jgi:hypothetical protein
MGPFCSVCRILVAGSALAFLTMVPSPADAQEASVGTSRPVLRAVRIPDEQPLRIDGSLDDPVWRLATPATGFVQRDPDTGAPATERTEVRVAYDRDTLVIAATLYDSEPGRVLGNQMQRDQSFSADDRFIVTLDTFLDGRSGYVFQTNPAGALGDGLIAQSSNAGDDTTRDFGASVNASWDGIWTVRVRRTADGWTAEMELPFRTLNFDPQLTAWGINFQRTVRRKAEESVWTGYQRNEGVAHMPSAGRVEGLTGVSQGFGLDVKPYAVGNLSAAPGRGRPDRLSSGDIGGDLFYNLTPALRGNLSINTDFAETEVDARQVNLTRFPLFFEEKRDFFLQGASYFDFAREIGDAVTPFFSRRIGLDEDGIPQPIDVGGKVTGQAGAFDIGFVQVRTSDAGARPGADVTAARLRRRFLRESYAGILYTRWTDRHDAPGLQTAAADFALRTSTFLGSRTLEWSGWYIYTTNPLGTGRNIGRGSRVAFPNDPFYMDFSYRELQPNYNPAVGFVQRVGFRRYNPEVGYTWRFRNHPVFRFVQQELDWEFIDDMDNRLLSAAAAIRPLTVGLSDGSEFAYEAEPTYERLDDDFEISDGVTLPVGEEYRFTRHQISGSMADRYPVSLGGQMVFGGFYSGDRAEYQLNVSIRPRAGVALRVEAEHNVLRLAEGHFDTTVYRAIANTQFSPWMSLVNNLQYDDVTRLLGWQLRFRWIQRPGNDVFFVYTHNWQELAGGEARRWGTLDNRAATKLVYTLRF